MSKEVQRQLFHMLIGIVTIALLLMLGRGYMITAVFIVLVLGTLLINARMLGRDISFVGWFEERFERDDVIFPGWGSACYAAGALLALTVLSDIGQIAATIFILAIGDGFSSIVGRMGRYRLPWNSHKTLLGTSAFLLSSLPAWYFVGAAIIPIAALAAVVESLDLRIDDNLTIPIACVVFFLVI